MKNMRKIKVIAICGSLKFKEEMIKIAIQLELAGNVALIPIFPTNNEMNYTEEEKTMLGKMHKEKIKIADAIFVVNINGYIGESTKREIEYAKAQNKEILYLEEKK